MGLFDFCYQHFRQLLLHPPRLNYSDSSSLVFSLTNSSAVRLHCSLLLHPHAHRIVIAMHGQSGCSAEFKKFGEKVFQLESSFLAFDFSGCGKSEGNYVSLGVKQTQDLQAVLNFVEQSLTHIKQIYLWGRSMGAVTAIRYVLSKHNCKTKLAGLLLDSPFSSLQETCLDVASSSTKLPKFIFSSLYNSLLQRVLEEYNFDLKELEFRGKENLIALPCVFIVSKDDELVRPYHSQLLHKNVSGPKKIIFCEGHHNSVRELNTIQEALRFIMNSRVFSVKRSNNTLERSLRLRHSESKKEPLSLSTFSATSAVSNYYYHWSMPQLPAGYY